MEIECKMEVGEITLLCLPYHITSMFKWRKGIDGLSAA